MPDDPKPKVPDTVPMRPAKAPVPPPPAKPARPSAGPLEADFGLNLPTLPERPKGLGLKPDGTPKPTNGVRPVAAGAGKVEIPIPPPPKVPPQWKELEPVDRTDPVDHEVFVSTARNDTWDIQAASVRGKLHAHRALWRDDAYAVDWVDDWTILIVSDGAGSAPLARVGARIACDQAAATLKQLLDGFRMRDGDGDSPPGADMIRLRTFLSECARRARAGILSEAVQRGCQPKDMYCTFLATVHAPWKGRDLLAAIQVGDGAVGMFTDDDRCTLLGDADHGEWSSETKFLTTPHIEHEFDSRVKFACKAGLRALAVMSDGVSDDFFPEDKRLIELFIGKPVRELKTKAADPVFGVLSENGPVRKPEGGAALRDWLRYEKKGSSDDRTLLIMSRSAERGADK